MRDEKAKQAKIKKVLEFEAEKEKLKPLLGQFKRQMSHVTMPSAKKVQTTKNSSPPRRVDSESATSRNLKQARFSQ